jgi:hypothetical protein
MIAFLEDDWDVLSRHQSMFNNPIPRFDVPTYSIHIDHGAHVTFHDQALWSNFVLKISRILQMRVLHVAHEKKSMAPEPHPLHIFFLEPCWVLQPCCGREQFCALLPCRGYCFAVQLPFASTFAITFLRSSLSAVAL